MSLLRGVISLVSAGAVSLVLVAGCAPSAQKLADAEKQIQTLQDNGAPDSILSLARVYLYNIQTANKLGRSGDARINSDSLKVTLARAEATIAAFTAELSPKVQALTASIASRKSGLTGYQLRIADSMMAFVDSFAKVGWFVQAYDKAKELDTVMGTLVASEEKAKKTAPKVVGTWTSTEKLQVSGYEKRNYTLKADGTIEMTEEKNGQSTEFMKEDWKFVSSGTYGLLGDTVMIKVSHEKCERQVYTNLVNKDGKQQWIKKDAPTYDSTITNGSKDRSMTYEFMTTYLKKK